MGCTHTPIGFNLIMQQGEVMTKHVSKLIVLLGFTGAAMAQGLPSFEEVDTDADGQISSEEAAVIEGLDFVSADTNQDGSLSMEEYNAARSE
jgi:hypothetical protein